MTVRPFLGLLVTTATLATTPLAGQSLGLPVVNNGAPMGITLGAEAAFSNDDSDMGKGTAIGARAAVGIGFVGVSASISRFSPDVGDAIYSPGFAATLRLVGGPLVPFRITAQGGVGHYTVDDVGFSHYPFSLGLAATIPNPAFAIKPWIAPRIDVVPGGAATDTHFAMSGGVDLALLNGMAIRGAYDRIWRDDGKPGIFMLGIGFTP